MRYTTISFVALLMALFAAGSVSADKPAADVVEASILNCQGSGSSLNRYLTLSSSMRSTDRGDEMWMRFKLLERKTGKGWKNITPASLKKWRKRSGVDEFKSTQKVRGISTPASYQVVVSYRWYRDGKLTATEQESTNICSTKSKLPDLVVKDIEITIKTNKGYQYELTVGNTGTETARNFEINLQRSGTVIEEKTINSLAPGAIVALTAESTTCLGEAIEGYADPDGLVTELSEENNFLKKTCTPSS